MLPKYKTEHRCDSKQTHLKIGFSCDPSKQRFVKHSVCFTLVSVVQTVVEVRGRNIKPRRYCWRFAYFLFVWFEERGSYPQFKSQSINTYWQANRDPSSCRSPQNRPPLHSSGGDCQRPFEFAQLYCAWGWDHPCRVDPPAASPWGCRCEGLLGGDQGL